MLAKYGVANCSQNKDVKAKATRPVKNSKLELRILDLFANYRIEFVHHYFLADPKEGISHEFDFYLSKYNILIDADGVYFHDYLDDPNGQQVNDYYDDIRIKLVPLDHQFYRIAEDEEDKQVNQLVSILDSVDASIFEFDSCLFNWCRSISFPYPDYTAKRLKRDWNSLCRHYQYHYEPQCKIGESIIKHYHRSIYQCTKKGSIAPVEAWKDDNLLKQVIKNQLICANDVDPSKILRGFNASKICPAVPIFNPILARYLVMKYLSRFNTIFDPFSGFSGRLLGVASLQRRYIGQDLNELAVAESSQIIDFLWLSTWASVTCKDILQSSGEYECLFTCPPYGDKELYGSETVFKSCDAWISECLARFKCKRYVFVVNHTDQYTNYVKEVIELTSYFNTSKEKVVVIDRK